MISFFTENAATIIVGLIVLAVIIFAVYRTYKNSKASVCGCGCSGCSQSAGCNNAEKRTVI